MLFDGFMEDRSRGSVEDVAEFGEDAFFDGVAGLEVGLVAEGLEGGFFTFVKVLGNVDHYVDKLVASCGFSVGGESFAAETEYLAGLCACGYLDSYFAGEGGNLSRASEGGGGDVEHQVVDDVVAVAQELRVLELFDDHEKVAVDASVHGRVAFAFDGKGHSIGDACGYLERDGLVFILRAGAAALGAFLVDDLTLAVAFGADGLALTDAEGCLLRASNGAGSVAGGAGLERGAIFGAGAVAGVAFHVAFELKGLVDAGGDFLEGEFEGDSQVVAAAGALAGRVAVAGSGAFEAAHVESAEVHSASASENIAESGEDILHRHASGAVEAATTGAAEALRAHVVAELVVFGAFIGIGKHVVGLGRLLELLFSFLVVGVAVGVIFYGESAVGFLQLLGSGRFADAEHFIVISF